MLVSTEIHLGPRTMMEYLLSSVIRRCTRRGGSCSAPPWYNGPVGFISKKPSRE